MGGAARYRSAAIIGNPIFYTNGTPSGIDLANPYKSSPEYNVDLWVSYRRRIWNDKINWTVQLNVRDVQANGGLIAVGANPPPADASIPGGVHTQYRIEQPRSFYLESRFEW
jgi:hypothetical protein